MAKRDTKDTDEGPRSRTSKPTTVRLDPELETWLRERIKTTRMKQTTILNDAVRLYRATVEAKGDLLHSAVMGGTRES